MGTFSKNNGKNFQRTNAKNFFRKFSKKKECRRIKKKVFLGQGWEKILKTFLRKRVSVKILKKTSRRLRDPLKASLILKHNS